MVRSVVSRRVFSNNKEYNDIIVVILIFLENSSVGIAGDLDGKQYIRVHEILKLSYYVPLRNQYVLLLL
jgi:hypothetical protein